MFYKKSNGQLIKGNHIINKDYELIAKQPKTDTIPVKGEIIKEGTLSQFAEISVDSWENPSTKNNIITEKYEFASTKIDDTELPVNDWQWFESEDEAYLSFGIEKPVEVKPQRTRVI